MLTVLDYWTETLDQAGSVYCIYLDFSKAFDSVPHRRLLAKHEAYRISGALHA